MTLVSVAAVLFGQSSAPDTAGSDPVVVIVGVLIVTAIIGIVVVRRSKR